MAMRLPSFEKEKKIWGEGMEIIAGIDEAGRGPLAGPVVAGAVVVFPEAAEKLARVMRTGLIRDSKTLSPSQRAKAYLFIEKNFPFGVGMSSIETIDRVNILQATFLAMKKAISDLKLKLGKEIECILLDGRSPIPNISTRQENIVDGDSNVFSISAASIVAKVTRDRMMMELHEKYPEYRFDKHKGYGTKLHFEMIEKFGLSDIHRKSFKILINNEI